MFWITLRIALKYSSLDNLALLTFFSVILACLFYQFTKDKIQKKDFLDIICIIALVQVSWVYLQIFKLDLLFKVNPLYKNFVNLNAGFMGNTNLSGILLAICLLAFFRKGWCWCLPVFIYPFYKINCFTAIMALGIGIAYFILRKSKDSAVCIIMLTLLLLSGWHKIAGYNPRFDLWERLIPIIKTHPFVGWGIGQYRFIASPIISKKLVSSLNGTCAHNDLLQLWIDAGLVAVVIAIGFIVWLFVKYSKNDIQLTTIVLVGIISSLGFFTFYTPVAFLILGAMALMEKGG